MQGCQVCRCPGKSVPSTLHLVLHLCTAATGPRTGLQASVPALFPAAKSTGSFVSDCIVLSIQGPGQSWARVPLLLGSARKALRPQVEALKYWPPQRLPEGCRPCLQRQSSGTSLLMMPRPEPFLGLEMGTQSRYTGVSSTAPALGYALPTAPLLTWKGW